MGHHGTVTAFFPLRARAARTMLRLTARPCRRHQPEEDAMPHTPRARFAFLGAVVAVLAVVVLVAGTAGAKTTLTVYTAIEADDLKKYAARFNQDHPDIEVKWVRDSTGIVTAKLLAETANHQADVIWGLAATSVMVLMQDGMLQPYA